MKSFDADRPGFGLFEMPSSPRDLEMALIFTDGATPLSARARSKRGSDILHGISILKADGAGVRGFYSRFGKRVFDGLLIILALPIALPIVVLAALALWIEGGAPFYTQRRLGKDGKVFFILKLRTMVRDADAVLESHLARDPELRREWDNLQKLKHDPRVTRVGHFLRSTSLDELPQLLNVLRGQMSLVGPRPMMLDQLPMYGDPHAYNALRPGITGLWQTSARNNNGFSYRNQVDAQYRTEMSFLYDLKVLFKTVGVVLRRTGC
jgi:lipopolysaccharide/colanic/teichoic acid biosynthesis glycosyltransferase